MSYRGVVQKASFEELVFEVRTKVWERTSMERVGIDGRLFIYTM